MKNKIDENLFFTALDAESKKLRSLANELYQYLFLIKKPHKSLTKMSKASQHLAEMNIQHFDSVLNELEDAIYYLKAKTNKLLAENVVTDEQIYQILEFENNIGYESLSLAKKAQALYQENLS